MKRSILGTRSIFARRFEALEKQLQTARGELPRLEMPRFERRLELDVAGGGWGQLAAAGFGSAVFWGVRVSKTPTIVVPFTKRRPLGDPFMSDQVGFCFLVLL